MKLDDTRYDKPTLEALEGFHRVWGRVTGPAQPQPHSRNQEELLSLLHRLHRHYNALANLFHGEHRASLQKMARETARDFRCLQAEHYIREGDFFRPGKTALPKGKRAMLRSAVLLERSLAACADGMYPHMSAAAEARCEKATKLLIASI